MEKPNYNILEYDAEGLSPVAQKQIAKLKGWMENSLRPDVYIHEINKIILYERNKRS